MKKAKSAAGVAGELMLDFLRATAVTKMGRYRPKFLVVPEDITSEYPSDYWESVLQHRPYVKNLNGQYFLFPAVDR